MTQEGLIRANPGTLAGTNDGVSVLVGVSLELLEPTCCLRLTLSQNKMMKDGERERHSGPDNIV